MYVREAVVVERGLQDMCNQKAQCGDMLTNSLWALLPILRLPA